MSDSFSDPPARPRRRWRRVWIAIGATLSVLIAGTAATAYVVIDRLDGNITTVDLTNALGQNRPTQARVAQDAVNILLMGSDTREGQGEGYGEFGGPGRSDTTILLHINAERTSAIAVSLPRDLWAEIPDCEGESGESVGGYSTKFNAAFAIGGPACTIKTVESITDVFIDHYIVVDFNGFKDVVDALGGVPVCMEEAVDDPKSGLQLPAGESIVQGEQALAFVRARKTLGDGSDTQRIARQQEFLSSMVRTATSSSLLSNPTKLFSFLDATTASLTTDPGLGSVTRLASFGKQMRNISPDDVTFLTVPSQSRGDGANVELVEDEAEALFTALRDDTGWPPGPPTPTLFNGQQLTVAPEDVQVRVLNGTGTPGVAAQAADQLEEIGFDVVEIATANRDNYRRSVIRGTNDRTFDGAWRTLGASTDTSLWVRGPTTSRVLTLIVGEDFTAPREVLLAEDIAETTAPSTTAPSTSSPSATDPSTGAPSTEAPTTEEETPYAGRPGQTRTAADQVCAS
jgi:LCP family protein required for cell wall assembly